jgi:hypothetical protein
MTGRDYVKLCGKATSFLGHNALYPYLDVAQDFQQHPLSVRLGQAVQYFDHGADTLPQNTKNLSICRPYSLRYERPVR